MHRSYHVLNALLCHYFFFFNVSATTEIYTLSLHDALPISPAEHTSLERWFAENVAPVLTPKALTRAPGHSRSEEHTSELQSQFHLVCRLLLEKKKLNLH